ncbi:ORC3 family protein [Abortiporus biennis]
MHNLKLNVKCEMASTSNHILDDTNKTCIYLPPNESTEDTAEQHPSPFPERDLHEGYALRLELFKDVWLNCLHRVQTIVHDLQSPAVASIVSCIQNAHSDPLMLPNLPYPELPVIVVTAPEGGAQLISNSINALNQSTRQNGDSQVRQNGRSKGKGRMVDNVNGATNDHSQQPARRVLFNRLSPDDCSTVMSTMKSIILGFVDRAVVDDDENEEEEDLPINVKRKATTSLASFDISLLEAWYVSVRETQDDPPLLTIVLHDFEQLDPSVMQDVFYICSKHVPSLPLVFLLELSSPTTPSYLHIAYPRSTLALLDISSVRSPAGPDIVEEVLARTFFDVEYNPEVMLGPAALEYLVDFTTRHSTSVDAALNVIQLALLKHFEEPFTFFLRDILLGTSSENDTIEKLEDPESFNFLDTLLTRVWSDASSQENNEVEAQINWKAPSIPDLLQTVSDAKEESSKRTQKFRLGYQVLTVIQKFMKAEGYRTTSNSEGEQPPMDLMVKVAKGKATSDVRYLALMVKKLSATQLDSLLSQLHQFFQNRLTPAMRREEEAARVRIVSEMVKLQHAIREDEGQEDDLRTSPSIAQIATSVGDWLSEYIHSRLVRLDQGILWDVWNTGTTPFPSEILNPAPRITVINALLRPFDFARMDNQLHETQGPEDIEEPELWELPDTSILFRRYMEAGKMINVYDWFESFAVALDAQRRHLLRKQKEGSQTPQKNKGKGKAKAVDEEEEDEEEIEETEKEQEAWRMEVQARFIRSLHELDFMGFIKHTGRKADHVIKTTYDLPD